jgi:hypothetical protein
LLKEILIFLKNKNDSIIFEKSKSILESCCLIKNLSEMLTPLEQLLYITPMHRESNYLEDMFSDYSPQNKKIIQKIITKIFSNPQFNDLYPDIKKIASEVQKNKSNKHIDCRGIPYVNKCILNVVHDSNMIDESELIKEIRSMLPIDIQNSNPILTGGNNELVSKYDKYKKLFLITGDTKYKIRYKSLKKILKEL